MSTTRSTMSQVTSLNNRLDSLNKESTIILPKLSDSKIIFVNNYNKNRNLSKSLQIKLPYTQEKLATNFPTFPDDLEKPKNIKPILKNSLTKRLRLDLANGQEPTKNVKFIDQIEEEDAYGEHTTNVVNNNEKVEEGLKNKEEDGKENLNDNLNVKLKVRLSDKFKKELKLIEDDNENENNNKSDKFVNSLSNKWNRDREDNGNSNLIKKGDVKVQPKIQFNKSLAEIIMVPSFRNFNIYRTSSKDFINKNTKQEEPHVKCKCCTIF